VSTSICNTPKIYSCTKKFQVAIYKTHKHLQPSQNFQVLTKIITAEYLKEAANIYSHQINCRCLLKLQMVLQEHSKVELQEL